jgi:site-specific recombinase XerD
VAEIRHCATLGPEWEEFTMTRGKQTPGPRKAQRIPEVLTAEERAVLLKQTTPRYPTGLRNRCLMLVMLDCGLRAREALQLEGRDIDWQSGKLKVRQGKGKKDRVLWLNEEALEWLRRWRERRLVQKAVLFTTLAGKPLRDNYLRVMVKRYGQKAGIGKDVHPHMLRHTFATDLYRETKNIRLVQKALGHASLGTTMIYTHIVDDELEDALRTFRRVA